MEKNELASQPIPKLLWKFSLPATIGMLVQATYNVVDRFFIGKLGPLAMTGIGLSLPIMTGILAVSLLVGIGAASRISLFLGQNKVKQAERVLGNAFSLIILIMAILMVVGLIFKDSVIRAFGASPDTFVYAIDYVEVILMGSIFAGLSIGLNHTIRAQGSPMYAMKTMLIGAGTNIILDPILIFSFDMGIRGAALATIISQFISTVWVLYYFIGKGSPLRVRRSNLIPTWTTVLHIFSIGFSPFLIQISGSIVMVIANSSLKYYGGDLAIGAMTIINALMIFFFMPIFGICQGMQPIVGYNFGAQHYDRVKKTLLTGIWIGIGITTLGFALLRFFPNQMIGFFNSDQALLAITQDGLFKFTLFMPLIGFQIVLSTFFQAIGEAGKSIFMSLLRQLLLLVPFLFILPRFIGLDGIWYSWALSDLLSIIVSVFFGISIFRRLARLQEDQTVPSTNS